MSESEVTALIAGLQTRDARLYQALTLLNRQLGDINRELHPTIRQSAGGAFNPPTTDTIEPPTNFKVVSTGTTVRFTWDSAVNVLQYEIRRGTDWDTAHFVLRTTDLQADIDPLVYGDYSFLIKSMTIGSSYSVNYVVITFTVFPIPAVIISSQVIDNNVLLLWNAPPSTFVIRSYIVKKDGVEVGRMTGTFTTFFEAVPGTFRYAVVPIDLAGNIGDESSVLITVNQPPDYALHDTFISTLNGTRVNVLLLPGPKLLASWARESYQAHFRGRGYNTWQAKINAGYIPYISPAAITGSYTEQIDYGTVISNLIVNITYNTLAITPAGVSVTVKMQVSSDNVTYTPYTNGAVQFFATFRYLRFQLVFTGVNDKALIELYNLTVLLNVKRENDGGDLNALATDVSGTPVLFNKAYKDVESITVTVKETTVPYIAIYDFLDAPNPTGFKVYVYNTAGARVSKTVSWKARGIV